MGATTDLRITSAEGRRSRSIVRIRILFIKRDTSRKHVINCCECTSIKVGTLLLGVNKRRKGINGEFPCRPTGSTSSITSSYFILKNKITLRIRYFSFFDLNKQHQSYNSYE